MPYENLSQVTSPSRLLSRLVGGVVLANLFMLVMVMFSVSLSRDQYRENAENMTRSLAHILEENFVGLIEKIDISMLAVNDEISREFSRGGIDAVELNRFLSRHQAYLPEIDSLRVADEFGIVKYGPGVKPGSSVFTGDRNHFIYLKTHNDGKKVVGAPIFARLNQKWVLPVARRINYPNGSFAGIVYAFISLDRIQDSFSHLNVGPQGVVNLRDSDFKIIVRYPASRGGSDVGKPTLTPELQEQAQSNKEMGSYRVHGVIDGVERTYSYHKIAGLPLYMTVGLASDDYLADWHIYSYRLYALLACFMLFSILAAWLIYRGEKHRIIATQALAELNRDFITLLESTTDFIYFKGKDSRIRFCSQTLADITGHTHWQDIIGKHDLEIFPEDMARIYYEEELPVFRDGTPILNRVDPYYDEQGKQGWVSTNKWPILDQDGKTVIGLFGISRDITEYRQAEIALRESEQRFRNMFHKHSSIMLLIAPDSGQIIDANAAAVDFYGYTREELCAMTISHLNTLNESEIYQERQLAQEQQRNHFVFPHRLANGEIRTVEVYSTPIDDGSNRILLFSIVHDITERQKAELALQRSNADLERFAYSVSHDMRQPLRAISGHLQLLQLSLKDRLDEEERENMNFALDGAKRMDSMIVSLLEYSRVGRKTESKQWIGSRTALDEALGYLAPLISQTGAVVNCDGVWPDVFASRDEMTRLFQNLIANAIKFRNEEQEARVEVDSSLHGNIWRVSVRDYGLGIAPDQIGRLFMFFSRLQSRVRFEGTGMGLALCRRIVEHHGGRIWVESEGEGKGSSFIFELPVKEEVKP